MTMRDLEPRASDDELGGTLDIWTDARGLPVRAERHRARRMELLEQESDGFPELTLVLPEEAVGVGARWTTKIETEHSSCTSHSELVELDGSRVRVRIRFTTRFRRPYQLLVEGTGELAGRLDELVFDARTTATFEAPGLEPAERRRGKRTVEAGTSR